MCGVTGLIDLRGTREIDRKLLKNMNDTQYHRGPDGDGLYFEPGVGLGHRRLSIIDLDGGHQPMLNDDRSVVITYNGEIYNFRQQMKDLSDQGFHFRTRCDTEVVLHAWTKWGERCVDYLDGMFAFAIWDRRRNQLFLARDRFGKKPLHYTFLRDGYFAFASELKALLAHPGLDRTIDNTAVKDYMTFGYVPDPKTIFSSVKKLDPGHCMLIDRGAKRSKPREYWKLEIGSKAPDADEDELAQELISRLSEATRKRMIADVPLGAFLSGGVDSSGIVSLMAEISSEPVNTCSISFGDPKYNESQFAKIVADQLNTRHYVEQVDSNDFSLIDQIPQIYDEPFADSSAIPTYRVCELARKHVTVALSGDGGDEVFAGYRRYRWHMNEELVRQSIPQGIRRPVFEFLGRVYPKMDWAPRMFRAKSTFQAMARDSVDAYLHSVSILPNDLHNRLFAKSFVSDLQGYNSREVFRKYEGVCDPDDQLSLIQYLDIKTYLPGDILTKVDRASMANSLEVRVPLLDSDFVSWAWRLPPNLKLRNGEGKFILKKALSKRVPDDVLYREKMGFAVPLASWFRGPLKTTIRNRLEGSNLADFGAFDSKYISELLNEHIGGSRDHSAPIWALLVFEGFLRNIQK